MSCLWCQSCHGNLIDTDDDVEAYIPDLDKFLCEGCRDQRDEEIEMGNRADAAGDALREELIVERSN